MWGHVLYFVFGEKKGAGIFSYRQDFGDSYVHNLTSTTMIIGERVA